MSADRCGNPVYFVKLTEEVAEEDFDSSEAFLSGMALRVLHKIRHKYPNFYPKDKMEIWAKAYRMGITEEE